MNQITPFSFNGAEIRTITKDGEPWFVASDVASFLGYTNPRKAIRDHCKGVNETFLPSAGGEQSVNIIPERDLYRLVMRSKLPAAQAFEEWVVGEVLPAIRKTGGYQLPKNMPEALRLLADEVEKNQCLQLVVQQQQPAVDFVQKYVAAPGTFTIRETAKIVGMQQNAFVKLCEGRVLFRENGTLCPYSQWLEAGYFVMKTGESNEHAFKQTKFTSKGVEWVRRYLKIDELLGNTEQKEAA